MKCYVLFNRSIVQPEVRDATFAFGPFSSDRYVDKWIDRQFGPLGLTSACGILSIDDGTIWAPTEANAQNAIVASAQPAGDPDNLPLDSPAFMNASPVVQREIIRLQEKVAGLTS